MNDNWFNDWFYIGGGGGDWLLPPSILQGERCMTDNEKQTKLEDRVHELEEDVRKMRDKIFRMESALRKECPDAPTESILIDIDSQEALEELQALQKAIETPRRIERDGQALFHTPDGRTFTDAREADKHIQQLWIQKEEEE